MLFKQSKTIKAQIFNLLNKEQIENPALRIYRENYLRVLAYFWYKQANKKLDYTSGVPVLNQFLTLLITGKLENPETIRRCWQEVRAENPRFIVEGEARRRAEKARKTKEYYSML